MKPNIGLLKPTNTKRLEIAMRLLEIRYQMDTVVKALEAADFGDCEEYQSEVAGPALILRRLCAELGEAVCDLDAYLVDAYPELNTAKIAAA